MNQVQEFIDQYTYNKKLTNKIFPVLRRLWIGDFEGVVAIGKVVGYDFTEEELAQVINEEDWIDGFVMKPFSTDDLTKVEGIGPKVASILNRNGVISFIDIAQKTPDQIAEIIEGVRGNYNTETWPAQAQMAAEGRWEELKQWQDELHGGRV